MWVLEVCLAILCGVTVLGPWRAWTVVQVLCVGGSALTAILVPGTVPMFWAHTVAGIVLLRAAQGSRHGPPEVPRATSLLVGVAVAAILVMEIVYTHLATLHAVAHLLVFLPMTVLVLMAGCYTGPPDVRRLVDAGCYWTIGCILVYHRHDTRPLPLLWHTVVGVCLLTVGGVTLSGVGQSHDTRRQLVLTLVYNVTGVLLLEMAVCLYLWRDGELVGLHSLWHPPPNVGESMCVYTALAVVLSVGHTVLLWRAPLTAPMLESAA